MELSFTRDTINQAAESFLQLIRERKIVAFQGEMGAGKTTFIHALCDVLKVTSPVSSPTFSIINQYSYPGGTLCHLDLYRLKDEEEARQAGVEDCLYSGNRCWVEWPERAPQLLPDDTLWIRIDMTGEDQRQISVRL